MGTKDLKLQKAWTCCCLIKQYYEIERAGGSLHIVLDDGNIDNDDVEFCLSESISSNDYWGKTIALLLLEFTKDEREQIIDRPHEISQEIYA